MTCNLFFLQEHFHPFKNTSTVPFSFLVSARWLWHYRAIIAAVCIDWFRCLLRFQTGAVEPLWPLIASTDAVAADVIRAKLPGFNVQAVRHPWAAEKMG
jgi:hypothetical protein